MIATVYNGQNIFLLDVAPQWETPVIARFTAVMQRESGLTNRETRRPLAGKLRCELQFDILAQGADARRIAGGLRTMQNERVVVPLWPAMVQWADRATRPIGGGLNLVFKEAVNGGPPPQWEIYEGVEPGWPLATDLVAPLLWGRLEHRDLDWQTPELGLFRVVFTESSPAAYAIAPAAAGFVNGPTPAGYGAAPKVFPIGASFTVEKEGNTITILREEIGLGREPAETLYPQAVAREGESSHTMTSLAEAGTLLRFFLEHGFGKAFWASDYVSEVLLTQDVGALDTVLHVADTGNVQVGDYLGFFGGADGGYLAGAKVTAVGVGTATIAAAVGAFQAGTTLVTALLLSSFKQPLMELQWSGGDFAECQIPVREVPAEYAPAADETLGTTIGVLATRCHLYEFARVLGGVTFTDRFTSFESDLTYGGHTYASAKVSHGDIRQGLKLDADEVEIRTDMFVGNPLTLMAQLKMEAPLRVNVLQGEAAAGAAVNVAQLFSGEIVGPQVTGSRIKGPVVSGGTMFDRKVPRPIFSPYCNHDLFDVGCGLLKADWKWTAKINDPGTAGYPFTFVLDTLARVSGAAPTYTANWFALGWMELNAGGANCQRRAILLSTVPVAGVLTVTLDRDPDPFPAIGDNVVLYPGCDLTSATCQGKFSNYLNFFGHPFMPIGNPSLTSTAGTPTGGGKK